MCGKAGHVVMAKTWEGGGWITLCTGQSLLVWQGSGVNMIIKILMSLEANTV